MKKKRRKYKNRRIGLKGIVIAVAAIAALAVPVIASIGGDSAPERTAVNSGLAYIQALEKKDISRVQNAIKEIKNEEKKQIVDVENIDIWGQFDDTVILGDSRAASFYEYEFLEQRRVLAASGDTILSIPDWMDELGNLNPSNVILSYGMNDIEIGIWPTPEAYMADVQEMIDLIHETVPDVTVYMNYIIPALGDEEEWEDIPKWNDYIEQYCQNHGIPFVDLSGVVADHSELYEPDGAHMTAGFYEYWAKAIVTETLKHV